ncbi:MAG TPA: serine hydrolase domain-containing protein [Vicinamibacterales bacterium]
MCVAGASLRGLLADFQDRFSVVGAGAAVITRDNELLLDVVGHRQDGSLDSVTVDDQWHIGSCGKSFTAALYARLVERGAAAWGVPIAELFRDLGTGLDPGWKAATVDELLVCRSGIRANLSPVEMRAASKDESPLVEQRSRAAVSALSRPPRGRGTFRYSNLGYVVVGAAIDRIAGMPFEAALRTYLLEPLNITAAGFGPPPVIRGHRPRVRFGNLCIGRGLPMDPQDVDSDNPAVMTPAGRLHLTLADWAKFQRLFLLDGGDLLQRSSIQRLLAVPAGKGSGMAMGWAPVHGLEGASFGMQGSNTFWIATAIIDAEFERTAMVVVNDGRTSLFYRTAQLAARILRMTSLWNPPLRERPEDLH